MYCKFHCERVIQRETDVDRGFIYIEPLISLCIGYIQVAGAIDNLGSFRLIHCNWG